MSNFDNLYDNFPDKQEKRAKKRKIYSHRDFVPGVKGRLIKLLTAFTIFLVSTGLLATLLSSVLYLHQMLFMLIVSSSMFIVSWAVSVVFEDKSNFYKVVPMFLLSALFWLVSPYNIILTIAVIVYNFGVAIIAISRLRLPEKLAYSQSLVISSCLFYCVYQIIYAVAFFDSARGDSVRPIVFAVGIIWIVISLFILNIMNITRNADSGASAKSIIVNNVIITAVFTGALMFIANFGRIKEFIENAIRSLIVFLIGTPSEQTPVEEAAPPPGASQNFPILPEATEPSAFAVILEKIIMVIMIAVFAVAAVFLLYYLFKYIKKLVLNLLDYLKENDKTSSINKYKDEQESVFDKGMFSIDLKTGWENFKKRFRQKEKYSDKNDNRQRIRYLYKELMINDINSGIKGDEYLTARDKITEDNTTTDGKMFAQGYEKARYSMHDVSDEEVSAALNITGLKK